jgi:hypothetical protein
MNEKMYKASDVVGILLEEITNDEFMRVTKRLSDIPSSVVRCKDCKWQCTVHDDDDNSNYYMCGVWSQPTDIDAFCSWGERRSE